MGKISIISLVALLLSVAGIPAAGGLATQINSFWMVDEAPQIKSIGGQLVSTNKRQRGSPGSFGHIGDSKRPWRQSGDPNAHPAPLLITSLACTLVLRDAMESGAHSTAVIGSYRQGQYSGWADGGKVQLITASSQRFPASMGGGAAG